MSERRLTARDNPAASDDTEATEVDVVDQRSTQLSGNDAALATYSLEHGPLSFKILPIVSDGGTDWRLVGYSDGVQGPVLEVTEHLSREAAEELGLSPDTRERLNDALQYAQEHLSLSPELGDRQRDARRLTELEQVMANGETHE